jgi:hypothetical protein
MVEDTETQLIEKFKKSKLFALQLDESTDIQNNSILHRETLGFRTLSIVRILPK